MREEEKPSETEEERLTALLRRCGKFMFFHSKEGMGQGAIVQMLRDGPLTQKEIQDRLGVSPGTVSELITKLEGKGALNRQRSEEDRRRVLLTLTEKGRRIAEKHAGYSTEGLYQALTGEERAELERLLKVLTDDWKERRV